MTDPVPPVPGPPPSAVPPVPAYQAPPGAYRVPVGGYPAPAGSYTVPDAAPRASATMGILALVLALLAAIGAPLLGGVMGFQIGRILPDVFATGAASGITSTALLSPARDQVLWAEIAFWAGTVLGTAAFVLGIVATVKRRGRGQGIAAIVLAALGPVLFGVTVSVLIGFGAAAGAAATLGAA
ncbi:hypothetical protein [Microbacterium neungamense]|uniref:hypothetical protein n=1 Tax=Microbacterium neungamense TaxID=2810535 RepID=UPI00217D66DD|nr:hypothetical protein [Microbacterium neungamense]UWF76921.1 hypothetical protein JSY13_08795 [Microbacterium neungamense]